MNYLMLLSLMLPVTIILFLVSALFKEENNLFDRKSANPPAADQSGRELCCQKINNKDKRNPKDFIDLSGGNWGI
ncbi:MAG: hypothetical protein ACXVPN_13065 [Bacteroidia bacterium]